MVGQDRFKVSVLSLNELEVALNDADNQGRSAEFVVPVGPEGLSVMVVFRQGA